MPLCNHIRKYLLTLLLCTVVWNAIPSGNACAQPPNTTGSQQLVSINFNNVDIGVFIKFISDLTKTNFVIDDKVRGKVSIISPGEITVAEAYRVFESVLEVHGYAAVTAGKIVKIVPSPEARSKSIKTRLQEEAGASGDSVVTQIIPLRYADPDEIKRLFTPLVSKNSVILSYGPTNTLIITDVQSNINRLLHILKAIDITGVGQQIAIIPVQNADATKLVNLLNSVFKSRGKGKAPTQNDITFVADERTNVIVVLASEADTENIRALVKKLDSETPKGQAKIRVYYLEHASAEDIVKVLQDIPQKNGSGKTEGKPSAPVVSDNVRITADKATNSLIIMADQEEYATLEDIIQKIDIPRAMVYIEALIMEVNVNKDFRLGTEWLVGGKDNHDGKDYFYGGGFGGGALGGDSGYSYVGPVNAATGNSVAALPPGFSLGLFGESLNIGGVKFPSIGAVVQAYKKDRDVHILSTPQILTTDNQEAKIYVGKNVPFQTQAGVPSNSTSTAYNTFEYRDVGKTLKITPTISKDRMVRLAMSLEVTDIEGGTTDFRPTTLKRTVDTTAIVQDRHTIVLGGLIDDTIAQTDYKVPCLGDVPGFGWLFRSTAKGNTKTNLYIFLTPRVIQNPEEAKSVYSGKRRQIDALREGRIKLYDKKTGKKAVNREIPETVPATVRPEDKPMPEQPPPSSTAPVKQPVQDPTPKTDSPDRSQIDAPGGESNPAEDTASSEKDMIVAQTATQNQNTVKAATAQDAEESSPAKMRPPESATIGFTIQVISVKDPAAAEKLLRELSSQGFMPYKVRTVISGENWYRLRIGYFEKAEAAKEIMEQLRKKHYTPYLVEL